MGIAGPLPPSNTGGRRSSRALWVALAVAFVLIVPVVMVASSARHPAVSPAPTYQVTFTETGLRGVTNWSVTLAGKTVTSTGSTVIFDEETGTFAYTLGSESGYQSSPASGTIVVSSAAVDQQISFAPTSPSTYSVTFLEDGLEPGAAWSVSLGGTWQNSSATTVVFDVPDGTYSFTVSTVASNSTPMPSGGTVNVSGTPLNIPVIFSHPPAPLFTVTFYQNTLPTNSPWSVSIGGEYSLEWGNIDEYQFSNGTYPFTVTPEPGYLPTPANGTVTLAGVNVTVVIVFTPAPEYPLTFTETGLPPGTGWYVDLDFSDVPTSNSSLTFLLSNGTYPYFIVPTTAGDALYYAVPDNGTARIEGTGASVSVTFVFSMDQYTAFFTESGLPGNTNWYVNISVNGNLSQSGGTDSSTIGFTLTNGTYGFTVPPEVGYTPSPSQGYFTISGANANFTIEFSSSPSKVTSVPVVKGGSLTAKIGVPTSVEFLVAIERYTGVRTAGLFP